MWEAREHGLTDSVSMSAACPWYCSPLWAPCAMRGHRPAGHREDQVGGASPQGGPSVLSVAVGRATEVAHPWVSGSGLQWGFSHAVSLLAYF